MRITPKPGRPPLSAADRLRAQRSYPNLLPALMRRGLALEDAAAVAHNAATLYHGCLFDPPVSSPWEVLERLSLGELARLCGELLEEERADGEAGEVGI